MLKKSALIIVFSLFSIQCFAVTLQDNRRIEEIKRTSLRPTQKQTQRIAAEDVALAQTEILSFFQKLIEKDVIRYSDVTQVFTILLGQSQNFKDFPSQRQFLIENDILPKKLKESLDENQPLTRGLAAIMFYNALELRGGITLMVFGPSKRYTHKELVYEDIMIDGDTDDFISGRELSYVFVQAVEFLEKRNERKNE